MGRQVATLCILHARRGILGDLALVNIWGEEKGKSTFLRHVTSVSCHRSLLTLTVVPIALVSLVARTEVAAERVGAVAEDRARPVLAFVVVRHVAALAAVAVVAVALGGEAGAVHALPAGGVQAVV